MTIELTKKLPDDDEDEDSKEIPSPPNTITWVNKDCDGQWDDESHWKK